MLRFLQFPTLCSTREAILCRPKGFVASSITARVHLEFACAAMSSNLGSGGSKLLSRLEAGSGGDAGLLDKALIILNACTYATPLNLPNK
eukprot:665899-Amphidinium_carterae.1